MEEPSTDAVPTIAPNVDVESVRSHEAIADGADDRSVRLLGYPKYLIEFEVELKRVFFSNRTVTTSVTVDGISGGGTRNDRYPEIHRRSIPETALLQARLDDADARSAGESVVRRYIAMHYPQAMLVFGIRSMEQIRFEKAYKLFYVIPDETDAESVTIVDTITGDVVLERVSLEEVTADDLAAR